MQKLKDLMSRNVQIVSSNATIKEAAQQMLMGNFGLMPVGKNDALIGTISDRDIAIRAVAEGKGPNTLVHEVMTKGVICAHEDDSVDDAVKLMSEHQIRRLPIMNADKQLVGIVSLGDFAVEGSDIEAASEALLEISKPS